MNTAGFGRIFSKAWAARSCFRERPTRASWDSGVKASGSETCLPVKVFHGHVLDLTGKADYIFIPRI
jgi:predicted nucleotide-binding protein (sugar kinase/HSP70/actin superfamily)